MNPFDWPSNVTVELARVIRLLPAREQEPASLAKGEWRSDSPYQNFSKGHIFCPVQSAITGSAAEKVVLSARPHAFRAANGLKRVDHSSMLHLVHPGIPWFLPSPSVLESILVKFTETDQEPIFIILHGF